MKKMFKYASLSAIAFVGAVSFSACSSSDDVVENNPNYNPETNSVKTEFTISLPNYVGTTRQTAAVAQVGDNPTFRGMQNLVLIPYGAAVDNESTPLFNKVFTLPNFGSSTDSNWDLATQKAKVYKNLDVPLGTKVFMFYGQAAIEGTDFANGKLVAPNSYAGAASTYNFALQPILPTYTFASDTKGSAICTYLKDIRATTGITSSELQSLLTNFKPTAASSASVLAAVQDLWDKVRTYSSTDPTGVSNIETSIKGSSNDKATITSDVVAFTDENLTGYPANLNIPDGAVAIDWSTPATPAINGPSIGLSVTDLTRYVYPAALYYRANSTIGVSSTAEVSKTYSTSTWETIAGSDKYSWNGTVNAETRSVALHDQIQYAVGRFDLSIKAAAAALNDNYGKSVTVPAAGFPVSAVIIGGQKNVKYDFTPSGNVSYSIYDNVMNGTVAAKVTSETAPDVNHTLVLETATTAKQVNVAVELTNNTGAAFKGKDGTVPAGGKFYLIGTLDLDKTEEITQPTAGSRSKIFEQDYITKATFTINVGTAHAGDGAKDTNTTGLGAAYNVVPDLTASQLEVAFSVDLSWTTGLTFNISI